MSNFVFVFSIFIKQIDYQYLYNSLKNKPPVKSANREIAYV